MIGQHWRTLRTLGRGASGAVVSLASDAASGELFAVKSAGAAHAAALRREQRVLSGLASPHVVRCVGGAEAADGSYRLVLEYAPGGSLADAVARNGGAGLGERAARAYAADVLRGLAYLHARAVVHGDVKPANVVLAADGRAKLADFGCARAMISTSAAAKRPIGGTPGFMAPEVARGEEQGPPADVWALGCTVLELATGRAPWSDVAGGDVLAAVHRIGYTDAVPEAPLWLSPDARDFLFRCFARDAAERWTAARLLEHPFVHGDDDDVDGKAWPWVPVSPKSTLDAGFWDSEESESDDEADENASASERIKSLACPASAVPDWGDCEEGWIPVGGGDAGQVARCAPSKVSSAAAVTAGGEVGVGGGAAGLPFPGDELETHDVPFGGDVPAAAASVERQRKHCLISDSRVLLPPSCQPVPCNLAINAIIKLWIPTNSAVLCCAVLLCSIPLALSRLISITQFSPRLKFSGSMRDRPRSVP